MTFTMSTFFIFAFAAFFVAFLWVGATLTKISDSLDAIAEQLEKLYELEFGRSPKL